MTPTIVDALAWTLIHFVWQGAAIALASALALALLVKSRPRARYAVLGTALALMAASPVMTLVARTMRPSREAISFSAAAVVASESPAAPAVAASPAAAPAPPDALRWIVALWICGVALSGLRALAGWWGAQRMRRRGASPAVAWIETARSLGARLGLVRPVEISLSTTAPGPVTLGWWRPVILLPFSTVTALTPAEIEMVLAHELAHIVRRDYLVNLLQIAVETVLFYHPAVWWVSRRMRIEREHVADDLAIAACGDRVAYARAMAALDAEVAPAAVLAAGGGSLLGRIERLAGVPRREGSTAPAWLGALAVASAVVLGLGAPQPEALAGAKPAKPAQLDGFLGGLTAAGYGDLSLEQIFALHDHGVDPAYASAMASAGLGHLPVDDLIQLHDHGVRPDFVRGIVQSGLVADLATDTAIRLAEHGIDPAELARIRALSFGPFPTETLIAVRDHGVDAATFEVLRAIGPGDDPAAEAIELRNYGVTMDRIRSMRRQGFDKMTVTQVLALARGGVI
ncbi:MAG TPA: M56 family metallopeptidase [Candidatus Polarisedimenticolaceae bacterium]|nr:M56 family metallopeptidase [Candidatus Polarisedimenticolaceae bacterium]